MSLKQAPRLRVVRQNLNSVLLLFAVTDGEIVSPCLAVQAADLPDFPHLSNALQTTADEGCAERI
jgi:hypothetical protein